MNNRLTRNLLLGLMASLFTLSAQAQYSVTTASGNLSIHDDEWGNDYYYGKTRLMLRGYYDAYNVDNGAGNVFLRNSVFNHYDHSSYQSGSGAIPGHQTSMYGLSMFTQGKERLRINYSGHVGIGMPSASSNPSAPLHIWASSSSNPTSNGIYLYQTSSNQHATISTRVNGDGSGDAKFSMDIDGESGWVMGIDNDDGNKFKIAQDWNNLNSNTRLTIDKSTGYVGIGTTGPKGKLDVNGPIVSSSKNSNIHGTLTGYEGVVLPGSTSQYTISVQDGNGRVQHKWNATNGSNETFLKAGEDAGFLDFKMSAGNDTDTWLEFKHADGTGHAAGDAISWNSHLAILQSGNIGIGTTSPAEKLDVNGNIAATDVTASGNITASGDVNASRVTVQAGTFPDYVFAPDYNLMPLAEVEAYIQANRHLPKFPSATEVLTNGQDLGQLNILLTEKVEELTLHTIAQQKLLEAQEARIAALEALVKQTLEQK